MNKIIGFIAVLGAAIGIVSAIETQPLDTLAQSAGWGNQVVIVKYTDLTSTNSTNQTITAYSWAQTNIAYECVGMALVKPFAGSTNNDLTLAVGDATNGNTFVAATQVHLKGTPVWYTFGKGSQMVYKVANGLTVTFTGNSNDVAFANVYTAGEARVYFKAKDLRKLP